MRKALEGPSSRKKTNQQTKQPKDANALPRVHSLATADPRHAVRGDDARRGGRCSTIEARAAVARAVQPAARTTGCDRLADARVASAAELPGNERRGILGRRTHASRRHARTASGSGAFRRDARDLRTRTHALQRCVADAGAQRARRGGRCLLSLLLSALSLSLLSRSVGTVSSRAPMGALLFCLLLSFLSRIGPL